MLNFVGAGAGHPAPAKRFRALLLADAGARTPAPAKHYSSHADLLAPAPDAGAGVLDAIVVPAARPARHLRPALRLGARLDVPVLALCSHDATLKTVREMAWLEGATCIGVDVRARPSVLPALRTSEFAEARAGALGDLALKRNLGLVIARLAGWRRLLFLDDDISGLDPDQVSRAAVLRSHAAVGLRATSFPDNSVVCHAHRTGKADQDVFVSGSALAVRVPDAHSFFPEVYNEDWLFLAPLLDRRAVAAFGSVRQERYAPFADPQRARRQEFGDVLAEGLVGYLHNGTLQRLPTGAYWASFLERRAEFIAGIQSDCRAAGDRDARAALPALDIATQTLAGLTADTLVAYVDAWRADLATWQRFLGALQPVEGPLAALRRLGLRSRTTQVVTAEGLRTGAPARRRHRLQAGRTSALPAGRRGPVRVDAPGRRGRRDP